MEREKKTRRHWLAGTALALALLMLLLGETVLNGRMSAEAFVCYWLACVGFTVIAIIAAFRHVRDLRATTRCAQHELLEDTLKEIREEAQEKRSRIDRREPGRPVR